MDSCEVLGLSCALFRDAELSSLRKKLTASHSRNYRLRKKAQLSAEKLEVERCARRILNEIIVVCLRRTDLLEAQLNIGYVSPPPGDPPHESVDTLHQSG